MGARADAGVAEMKSISGGLSAILAGNEFLSVELYTFVLLGGTVLRYGDYALGLPTLVANGNSFPASGVKFIRSQVKQSLGLQVDQLTLDIFADPNDSTSFVNGLSFHNFVRGGGLDGATLQLDRCYMTTWGDCSTNGTMPWFYGLCSDAQCGRTKTTLTVKAVTELMNMTMPRDVYQPSCLNTLFDVNTCKLTKASFAVTGTVGSGSTVSLINTGLSNPAGYFDLGTIKFTSGANNGVIRTIQNYHDNGLSSGQLTFALPLLAAPSNGDTFTAYPGCNKTTSVCANTFSNLVNFRGMPFIPVPETAQ